MTMDDKNESTDETVRLEKDGEAADTPVEGEKTTLLTEGAGAPEAGAVPEPAPKVDKTVELRVSPATVPPASGPDAAGAPAARPRRRRVAVAACVALALCAALAGVGYASGWFSPTPADSVTAAGSEESAAEEEPEEDVAPEEDAATEEEPADEAPSEDDTAEGEDPEADDDEAAGAPASEGPSAGSATDAGSAAASSAGSAGSSGSGASGSGASSTPAPSAPSVPEAPAPSEPVAPAPAPKPTTITVHVSIDSSRAASYGYPSSMGSSSVTLKQGATVYDALLAMGVSVSGSSSYVRSIGGLSEFDCGDGSGWMYAVNGSYPSVGCGSYTLSGGESILWVYTLDLGNDL